MRPGLVSPAAAAMAARLGLVASPAPVGICAIPACSAVPAVCSPDADTMIWLVHKGFIKPVEVVCVVFVSPLLDDSVTEMDADGEGVRAGEATVDVETADDRPVITDATFVGAVPDAVVPGGQIMPAL